MNLDAPFYAKFWIAVLVVLLPMELIAVRWVLKEIKSIIREVVSALDRNTPAPHIIAKEQYKRVKEDPGHGQCVFCEEEQYINRFGLCRPCWMQWWQEEGNSDRL